MKQLLITIAALVLVGCGESQQSAPITETKSAEPAAEVPAQPFSPVKSKPIETVTEVAKPKPPTVKAPDISISKAVDSGNLFFIGRRIMVTKKSRSC
jgi:PBP1b-binding outer membrane lipoprotein LpoB